MVARSTDWPERRRRFTVLVVAFLIGPAIVAASVTAGGLFLVGGPIVAAALLFAFVASTRRRRDRAHVSKGLVRTASTSAPDRRIEAFFDVLERTSIQTLRMLAVRPLDRPAQELPVPGFDLVPGLELKLLGEPLMREFLGSVVRDRLGPSIAELERLFPGGRRGRVNLGHRLLRWALVRVHARRNLK